MKFVMITDSSVNPTWKKGKEVFSCTQYDYGLAKSDSLMFGFECSSISGTSDGNYPFIVHPRHELVRAEIYSEIYENMENCESNGFLELEKEPEYYLDEMIEQCGVNSADMKQSNLRREAIAVIKMFIEERKSA